MMTKNKEKRYETSLGDSAYPFDIEADMWHGNEEKNPRRTVSMTMYDEESVVDCHTKDPKKLREFAEWLLEAADFLEGKD